EFAGVDVKRGQTLFESTGCLNCHAQARKTSFRTLSLAELRSRGSWSRGCMDNHPDASSAAPDFGMDDHQRQAIRAFAATDWSSLSRDALPEVAERQMTQLKCTACHARDAEQDLWSSLTDE